jgi:hypothetical protein
LASRKRIKPLDAYAAQEQIDRMMAWGVADSIRALKHSIGGSFGQLYLPGGNGSSSPAPLNSEADRITANNLAKIAAAPPSPAVAPPPMEPPKEPEP